MDAGLAAMQQTRALPNGEWRGWFEQQGRRFDSNNNMVFSGGRVTGSGEDEFGDFVLEGAYRTGTGSGEMSVEWKKTYIGQHSLVYQCDECKWLPSGQMQLQGTWRLDPPSSWDGASGLCEFTSVNSSPEQLQTFRQEAPIAEPEEVAELTAAIATKLREVAEMRQKLQSFRGVADESSGTPASVGFQLTRSLSRGGSTTQVGGNAPESECIICFDHPRNSVLLWCGHQVLCLKCARLLYGRNAGCPVCRADIHQVQQTFTP
eukprot:TRINITY_DN106210_c0_g1_i1.p1 TRINITY_DN106210_c0_g1~~TRINITY_DN106210_c0_g1_i1.p1  ORF type:complete len:262 (-),score=32.49 TRINITY_DN106210_c0_g1_i1:40-825(-)